jgi:tetratricopeptide (TPR) repeat protein
MAGKDKHTKGKKRTTPTNTSFLKKYWQYILISVFSFVLDANSIPNDYAMDDELVTKKHRLTSQGIKAIPEIFTSTYYSDNMGYAYDYRPMVHVSFAIEHQLFGESAGVSHSINLLLYVLLCVLLYVVLKRLLPLPDLILVAILLLFIAHPIHTEVVCSIKNRDELLTYIFGFSAFYFALSFYRSGKFLSLILIAVFFTLSLLSKQTASMLAVLIPLSLILFSEFNWKRFLPVQLMLAIPFFFLMSATYLDKKLLFTGAFLLLPYLFLLLRDSSYFSVWRNFVYSSVKNITTPIEQSSSTSFSFRSVMVASLSADGFNWKQLLYPSSFLLPILLTAGMAYSFLRNENIWFYCLLSLMALLYFIGKQPVKWWTFILSALTILISGYLRDIDFELLAGTLFIHWCVFHAVRYNLWYIVPSLLFFVAAQIFNASNEFNVGFIIWGIALYVIRFRYGYIFSLLALIFLVKDTLPEFSGGSSSSVLRGSLYLVLYIVPLLLLWFKKEISYFYKPVFILVVAAFFFEPGGYTGRTIDNPIANTQVNIVPLHVDRPIKFVESPVNLQDPLSLKMGTSFNVLARYLKLVIIPYPLSYYYGYSYIVPTEFFSALSIISFVIHLLLGAAAIFFLRKKPIISFGLLWYLISISAFTSMVQTLPGMMGDRYLFGASLGFCILLGGIFMYGFKVTEFTSFSQIPVAGKLVLLTILVIYSGITIARNSDWKDYITLFEHDIQNIDNSSQAHNLLALRYNQRASTQSDPALKKGDYEKGLYHLKRAAEIYPDFLNVNFDIGRTYLLLQMQDSALPYFKRAAAIDSNFIESFNKIGEILVLQKKLDEAIPYFQYIIRKRPELYMGYDRLSFLYFNKREYEKSLAVNREAIKKIPSSPEPYMNTGRTFRAINQRDSALYYFEKADALSSGNAELQKYIQELRN